MPEVLEVKGGELSHTIDYGIAVDDLKTKVAADLAITINGVNDKAGYKLADTRRKEWVKVRTSIDKRRKEMNALAREHIKRVDGVAAELTEIAGQAEDHVTKLVDEIDAAIRKAEQDRIDAVFNAKNARLVAAGLNLPRILVDSMTDIEIDDKISEAEELAHFRKEQAEKEAKAKAEAERLAAEEKERNRIEAEKLANERAEFERQQSEAKAEQERLAKIEADKLAAERKRLDEEKAELERQKKEQADREAESQRQIDEENQRLAKVESDRVAVIDRQRLESERIERERIEAEEKEKQQEASRVRAEALRPDREKLLDFAKQLERLDVPTVSEELKVARELCIRAVADAAIAIRDIVEKRMK